MSEFSRRRGGTVNLAWFDVDTAQSRRVRSWLKSKKFSRVEEAIREARDINTRSHLIESIADWPGDPSFLEQFVQSSTMREARIIANIHALKRAWDYSPWTHGERDLAKWQGGLETAKKELLELIRDPALSGLAAPWILWAVRGSGDTKNGERVTEFVLKRCAGYHDAAIAAVHTKGPDCGGNVGQSFSYAREFAKLSGGIVALSIIAETHTLCAASTPGGRYWLDPDVRAEFVALDAKAKSGLDGVVGHRCRQHLAHGLWCTGEHARAIPHLQEIGSAWSFLPWGGMRFGLSNIFSPVKKALKECKASA